MDRLYFSLATLLSSGIFAYSYWREWVEIKWFEREALIFPDKQEAPYFHTSEVLYLKVLLIFAIAFTFIFTLSAIFTFKQKWKWVFICFLMCMICILAVMINGAIK
jgi:hypothetical protein